MTLANCLRRAEAMYAAKARGRNRVEFAGFEAKAVTATEEHPV